MSRAIQIAHIVNLWELLVGIKFVLAIIDKMGINILAPVLLKMNSNQGVLLCIAMPDDSHFFIWYNFSHVIPHR